MKPARSTEPTWSRWTVVAAALIVAGAAGLAAGLPAAAPQPAVVASRPAIARTPLADETGRLEARGEPPVEIPAVEPAEPDRGTPGAAPNRPPYPFALTAAVRGTLGAFDRVVTLDSDGGPLRDAMARLGEAAGIRIRLADGLDGNAAFSAHMTDMSLRDHLGLLCHMNCMEYGIEDDGTLVLGPSTWVLPNRAALAAERGLAEARAGGAGDEIRAMLRRKDEEATRARLRGTAIRTEWRAASLADVVAGLGETDGVPVRLAGAFACCGPDELPRLTLDARGRSAEEVLDEAARQVNGGVLVADGCATLFDRGTWEQQTARRRGEDEAVASLLARAVEFAGPEIAGHDIAGLLSERTGVPVVVGEEVWNREEPLPTPRGSRGLGEVLHWLSVQGGWEWRLSAGTVYLFRR